MNELLLESLAQQLKDEGACVFKNKGFYYNVYEIYDEVGRGFCYDKYDSMQDSEPLVSESCENDEEKDAILFAIL